MDSRNKSRLFVLDASFILDFPDIPNIRDLLIKNNLITQDEFIELILTTTALSEIDASKYKSNNKEKYNIFFSSLRDLIANNGKLSSKIKIDKNTVIFLSMEDLKEINNSMLDWINDDYLDKHYLNYALKLKANGYNVSILSQDAFMKIIAFEFDIECSYIPPESKGNNSGDIDPNDIKPSITENSEYDPKKN